jgi:hypothetical protein
MPRDSDLFDFFVSYARADNRDGWISGFVEELLAEHRRFSGGRTLTPFFDERDIHSLDDWQHRLSDGLARSRLFLAFLSPNYFARPWCRQEWRTWIDTELAAVHHLGPSDCANANGGRGSIRRSPNISWPAGRRRSTSSRFSSS